jgi:DNA repair protein RecO (recombination protein O)
MRRILRADALCLRTQDYRESSKLVTLLTPAYGRVAAVARGARRPKSRFGAALMLFARSRIIYHWHENRSLFTISDAELVSAHSGIAAEPGRYLAAGQMAEFALRTAHPQDPAPQLFNLLAVYLDALESVCAGFPFLACSFLLKAASFSGFRPELRRCLICRRPAGSDRFVSFDQQRGGIVCSSCAGNSTAAERLTRDQLTLLEHLLYTPAEQLLPAPDPVLRLPLTDVLPLVLDFLRHHFDPLVLHSFRQVAGSN